MYNYNPYPTAIAAAKTADRKARIGTIVQHIFASRISIFHRITWPS